MPRIRCHYLDCAFLDDGFCSAAAVELDPDTGCMTHSPTADSVTGDDWDETEELEEWEEMEEEDDDEDLWMNEEENEY